MNFREMRRQREAAFFTTVINQSFPTANPEVTVRRLELGEKRENFLDTNQVTVDFTGPDGDRKTFTTSSRDLMRDDDPGMERIAHHLHACFAPEQVREEEAEREPEL